MISFLLDITKVRKDLLKQTSSFYESAFEPPNNALREFYLLLFNPAHGAHKTFGEDRSLVKIFNQGNPVHPSHWAHQFEGDEGYYRDTSAILKAISLKSTVIFDEYYKYSPDVKELIIFLQEALNVYCGCNAYLSQAGGKGFNLHRDTHHTLIFAISGKKRWKIYRYKQDDHQAKQRFLDEPTDQEIIESGLCHDVIMNPGDLLYIPIGQYHQVENLESNSFHWTVSASLLSQLSILEEAVKQLYQENVYNKLSDEAKNSLNQLHPMYKKPYGALSASDLSKSLKACMIALNEIVTDETFLIHQQGQNRNVALKLFSQPSDELIGSLLQW